MMATIACSQWLYIFPNLGRCFYCFAVYLFVAASFLFGRESRDDVCSVGLRCARARAWACARYIQIIFPSCTNLPGRHYLPEFTIICLSAVGFFMFPKLPRIFPAVQLGEIPPIDGV